MLRPLHARRSVVVGEYRVMRQTAAYMSAQGVVLPWFVVTALLARDAQALIVAQCLSIHLSICVSVRDSLSHAYVRSIARREPRRLPACICS